MAELAAFCFKQLERSVTLHNVLDLNIDANTLEDKFQVRHYMCYIVRRPTSIYLILGIQIISAISDNVQRTTLDITRDSEQPSLPLNVPAIEAAQVLFLLEKDNDPADIMEIIQTCLNDIKKHNSKHAIKSLSQLIAVSEYIRLCACYNTSKACKQPCLKASMAIACQMGKGPYFTCQIRYNELYLVKHCHLPPCKVYSREGHHSLLDNKSVLHNVCIYLAPQVLGSVTPQTLC